eukprot:TRINITY_DN3309_c1_g1_i2.p1 TRINITY_DN3309_c1_g1~~TRINITY_DN3309_c1_g1_i2.p1  ORF type:complete len:249 (+),score=66.80 TRINITY_DN3309_c1_g1_i2:63-809(+)
MTKGKGTGATALKKAFRGRDYGERGQTKLRQRFGFLEKKQDYKKRAKSYKNKKTKLAAMREAANTRNPDEFHTAMLNTETDEHGRHMKIVKAKKGPQQALDNARNSRYLRHKAAEDGGVAKQMKSQLSFMGLPAMNTHQIFIEEDEAENFNAATYFDTAPELLDNPSSRGRISKLRSEELPSLDPETAKRQAVQYHNLSERVKRKQKLDGLLHVIDDRQKLLEKGKRVLTSDPNSKKKTFRWLYERKR